MSFTATYSYRSGTSFARGTDIDAYLPEEDVVVLYEKWHPTWPEPMEFHGGEKSITCEMVLEVPQHELVSVYKPARAKRILAAAKANAGG